ncbi:MAG: DUF2334 domain-containing protein [Cytophagales bacterium]
MINNSAKYIIRLDDASSYSNLSKWAKIEHILDKYSVCPVVAVIPKNMDDQIKFDSYNKKFWSMIKNWESKGWTIAMHGYNHKYHKVRRHSLVFPFYNRSEFGGLTIDQQKLKIKKSLDIFNKNGINPRVWIAPGHSFDTNTIKVLKKETNINIISDGISIYPFYSDGFFFIPQQLWKIKPKLFGIWTICLHPDTMELEDFRSFEKGIANNIIHDNIIRIDEIALKKRKKSILDQLYSHSFWIKYELKYFLKNFINKDAR